MIFNLGNYELDIDVEKTRDFYINAHRITDGCDCPGCRNYVKAVTSFCEEPKHILAQMGIQMDKACEVYVNCVNEDGSAFYGGWYHLCGKIIHGNKVWNEIGENHQAMDEISFVSINDDYRIAFTDEVALLESDFPMPVIQVEFLANIPWVLPEKCTY